MTTAVLDYNVVGTGIRASSEPTPAASRDAQVFRFSDIAARLASPFAIRRRREQAVELFTAFLDENITPHFTEEDGQISSAALSDALLLLLSLPPSIPLPELLPEPSGAIAMEWYKSPTNVFVVSVPGTGALEYAGIDGAGHETHGSCNFVDSLPTPIKSQLEEFLTNNQD